MFSKLFRIISITALLSLPAASFAQPVTKTWIGTASDLWSNPLNWKSSGFNQGAPVNDDSVRFDYQSNGRLVSTLDYDLTLYSVSFADVTSAAPTGSFTIGGSNTLTLRSGINSTTLSPQRIDAPLYFNYVASISNNNPNTGLLTFGGPINSLYDLGVIAGPAGVNILGTISGGGLTKTGPGMLTLTAPNTYTGPTHLYSASTIRLTGDATLGSASALELSSGSRIEMLGVDQTVSRLNGSGNISGAALTVATAGPDTFSGILSNTSLTKRGTGELRLTGANTYTGPTSIEEGSLYLNGIQRLHEYTDVTIAPAATLGLDFNSSTSINTLSGSGAVYLTGPDSTLTIIDRFNAGGIFSGTIDGSGSLVKRGNSELILTGVNTNAGNTNIEAGTLRVTSTGRLGDFTNVNISGGATLAMEGMEDQIGTLNGTGLLSLSGNANLIVTRNCAFAGNIVGSGGITIKGGNLSLSGSSNTYTGNTVVEAGTLDVNLSAIAPASSVIVGGGQSAAVYSLSGPAGIYALPSLTIQNSGTVQITPVSKKTLRIPNVTITGTGQLDLTNNAMILTAGDLSEVTANIASLRIRSTTAYNYARGVILNDDGTGQPLYTTFRGVPVSATDIIVANTVVGDLNLDGTTSIADFIELAAHFNQSGGWRQGDINYDGKISIADFINLASHFNATYTGEASPISQADRELLSNFATSIGADPAIIGQSVPEPALPLFLLTLCCLPRRHRKMQKAT